MFLEAVTVCARAKGHDRGYADIARYTLPAMRRQCDRVLVITTPWDEETKDLCHRLNLEFLETEDFHHGGDPFNKGKAIERGLAMMGHDDWLLHIDSDVFLPDDFRESLRVASLDPHCIYGADRVNLVGYDAFVKWRERGSSRQFHCNQSAHGMPIGARWVEARYGYVPIGYFQLWHQIPTTRKGIRTRRYPEWHANAARADVKFALQWDRRHRQIIPEVIVAHLESEPAPNGANWCGRKTKPFGPDTNPSPPRPPVS